MYVSLDAGGMRLLRRDDPSDDGGGPMEDDGGGGPMEDDGGGGPMEDDGGGPMEDDGGGGPMEDDGGGPMEDDGGGPMEDDGGGPSDGDGGPSDGDGGPSDGDGGPSDGDGGPSDAADDVDDDADVERRSIRQLGLLGKRLRISSIPAGATFGSGPRCKFPIPPKLLENVDFLELLGYFMGDGTAYPSSDDGSCRMMLRSAERREVWRYGTRIKLFFPQLRAFIKDVPDEQLDPECKKVEAETRRPQYQLNVSGPTQADENYVVVTDKNRHEWRNPAYLREEIHVPDDVIGAALRPPPGWPGVVVPRRKRETRF